MTRASQPRANRRSSGSNRSDRGGAGSNGGTDGDRRDNGDGDPGAVTDEAVTDEAAVATEPEHDVVAEPEHDVAQEEAEPSDGATDDAPAPPEGPTPGGSPTRWYGPIESVVRRPRLALIPVLVLVTLAAAYALLKPPTYKASSTLIVGSVVRDYQPAAGQTQANQELTEIYSRLAGSSDHMNRVRQELGRAVPDGSITASPVPNTPFVQLEATANSQAEAVARADAGAKALVALVSDLKGQANTKDQQALSQIDAANNELANAQLDQTAAQTAYNNAVAANAGQTALTNARTALVDAQTRVLNAQLQVDALSSRYTSAQSTSSGGVELNSFGAAQPMGSNRSSTLIMSVLVAGIVGALIGMALATLAANDWHILPPQPDEPVAPELDAVPSEGADDGESVYPASAPGGAGND